MRRVALAVLLLVAVALGVPLLLGPQDSRIAQMNGEQLAAHIRAREPDMDDAIDLIVPYAMREDGETEREALVHALAAGPGVDIYEPAAAALGRVGPIAVPTLRSSLRSDDPWIIRYSVIMLGRLADPADAQSRRALGWAGEYGPGGYHIDAAVAAALEQIAARGD